MFRHIVAALALVLAVAGQAAAQTDLQVAVDKTFVPCSGTTYEKTIHLVASCVGAGCTAQHRTRYTQTGPYFDSDGSSVYDQSSLATLGPDLQNDYDRLIHCNEWGWYRIRVELITPSAQGATVLETVDIDYEATYRSPIQITSIDSFSYPAGCSKVQMAITVKDADGRPVKGMDLTYESYSGNGSYGIEEGTTGSTISTAGKLNMTVDVSPNMTNGVSNLVVEHVQPGNPGNFLDPFLFYEVFHSNPNCAP